MVTTAAQTEVTSLAGINRIGTAFFEAKVMLSAVELGLFTELAKGPATLPEVCERLGLNARAARDFLSALVTLGVLRREHDKYANGEAAQRFLDQSRPGYAGAFLERANHMMYPVWGSLTGLLRTGEAQLPNGESQAETFARMMRNPEAVERFLRMMDAVSGPLAVDLADAIDWSVHRTVVDVGGARGNLVAQLVSARPHLAGGVFDLPPVEPSFHRHMAALGTTGQVAFTGGDFFADPMPAADVVIMGHVLHDWAPAERAELVARAFRAVNPGGVLLVYDPMVSEEPDDVYNTMVSLNMQLMSPGGSEYTLAECTEWLTAAGFGPVDSRALGDHDTLAIAHKPGPR
jgi:SAM-dependent methyltransferase